MFSLFEHIRSGLALLIMIGLVISAATVLQACGKESTATVNVTPDHTAVSTAVPIAETPVMASPTVADLQLPTPESATALPSETITPDAPPMEPVTPTPQVRPFPAFEEPTPAPPIEVPEERPIPRLVQESGQLIGSPHYDGMFLIGWDRLVTFHNDGVAGQVTITAEIHDSRLPYETGIENIGDESAAYSITESFDIEANETYVAVIEFGISLGGGSDSVRNTANRVCGANPVTGLFDSNCICTASNLSIRVLSDPIGLEFQTPELRETCGRSVQLQAIRLTDAPEPTPTPEPGLGILERVRTFTTLKRAENDRDPEPMGIAFSPDGNVYVAVDETHQVLIFDSSGGLQTTIGSGTRAFGSSDEGDLASPTDIAVDPEGNLFVSEPSNQRFQAFTKAGVQLFTKGEYGRDEGEFSEPRGIAISSDGEIYIADSGNGRIQVFDSSGEFLREWGSKGDAETEFGYPTGVAVSADGLVYVTDRNNDRVLVFTTDGTFKTSWQIMIRDQPAERPGGAIAIDPRGLLYTAANYDHDEYIIVTDLSGNYLDSWATPLLMIGGIAISPDYRALYVSDSMFARIEVLAINHQNIP